MNFKETAYKVLNRIGLIEAPAVTQTATIPTNQLQKNDFTSSDYRGGFNEDPIETKWYEPIKGLGIFDTMDSINKYRSFTYAAINKRAYAVAKADCYIYREFKSKKTEIKNHPFANLLKSENSYNETGKESLYLTSVMLDLYPDVYWQIIKTQTPFGIVVNEIIVLMSKYVYPIMNKQNTLIEAYEYLGLRIPQEDIIHFRRPNPCNKLTGVAPADAFNFTLDIEYLQGKSARTMFKNNANLEGILLFPNEVSDENKDALDEQFKSKYQGAGKEGKTMLLDNGAKYERTQANPREMDFIKSRLNIRDEILVILDVPKTVMNITDDVNYSNGETAMRSFIENSIQPFAEVVIESKINSYFRKIYGDRFLFKMEWDFKTDRKLQLETIKLYLQEKLIKKTVIAEQEGYTAEDVPDETQEKIKIEDNETAAA